MHELICLQKIQVKINSITPPEGAIGLNEIVNSSNIGINCDCMPGCNEIVCYEFTSRTVLVFMNDFP